MRRAYFMTVIDGVFCVGRTCDKQTRHAFQLCLCVVLIADSSFALANARVVDYPAVYCNDGFCKCVLDSLRHVSTCKRCHSVAPWRVL